MKKMRIKIGKDGKTTIQVEGGQGSDCEVFTKSLEQALGKVESRTFLPEHDLDDLSVHTKVEIEERL